MPYHMSNLVDLTGPATPRKATVTKTFTGASGLGQAGTAMTVFTVTGEILIVYLVPFCTVNLGEAQATATVALGVTGATTLFLGATNSTDIDANEFWLDATTPAANGLALPAAFKDIVITDNIIVTCATQNTNAGAIRFDLLWLPLSSDAAVA